MSSALERFLRYAVIDTTSQEETGKCPSTSGQFDLARLLVEELKDLGLSDAEMDDHAYVLATLPSNQSESLPVMGWLAHLDTSCAVSGKDVKPKVITYQDGEISLGTSGVKIPEDPYLKSCKGHRLVVADGTTLLGADDKAGIAIILAAIEKIKYENRSHGPIRICFTPDEEIGCGTDYLDIEKFGVQFAYTVDGNGAGILNDETFSADKAFIKIQGVDIHPGYAKGIMVNAIRILAEMISFLPADRVPELSEKRQPYIQLDHIQGSVSSAAADFILRAFDDAERMENRAILQEAFQQILRKYPKAHGSLEITEQYDNMKKFFESCPDVVENLKEAIRKTGLTPERQSIRGGTDGSRLSALGIPTPNIFTGGANFHSLTEFLSVDNMEKSVETLVHLAELWSR
ncbi:MAG: peptidase T [Planctomycetia bacterium]|nr:peptidase T [Planctomycetia bacterium]